MFKKSLLAVSFSISVTGVGLDVDSSKFSELDQKFSQRSVEQVEEITNLSALYAEKSLEEGLTADEKVYAVAQASRLDLFYGMLLPQTNYGKDISTDARKKSLENCLKRVDTIKNSKSAQYYYAWAACNAARGKLSTSTLEKLRYAAPLKLYGSDALKVAEKAEGAFEGGGIYRIFAAIKANPAAEAVGLFDPVEAMAYATKALKSPTVDYPPFTTPLSGEDYYENYYYLTQAKVSKAIQADDQKASKSLAEQAVAELGEVVEELKVMDATSGLGERAPELKVYLEIMQNYSKSASSCLKGDTWASCLKK